MPLATTCLLNGKEIDVEFALDLRENARRRELPDPNFKCKYCHKPVRPHHAGGHAAAHFEHFRRNPACPLSDPERN